MRRGGAGRAGAGGCRRTQGAEAHHPHGRQRGYPPDAPEPRGRKARLPHLSGVHCPPRPGNEACGGRVYPRPLQDHVLLYRRWPRGLPRAGQGSGRYLPHPHRAAPDRFI